MLSRYPQVVNHPFYPRSVFWENESFSRNAHLLPASLKEDKLRLGGLTFAFLKCGKMKLIFSFPFQLWLLYCHGHVRFKKREAQSYTMIIPWHLFYSFAELNPVWAGKWDISYGIPAVFWIYAMIFSTQRYKVAVDCFSLSFDWPELSLLASFLLLVKCVNNRTNKHLVPLCMTLLKACRWPSSF